VLSIDEQRPGDADRHLRDPGEVLDVPRESRRVKGVVRDVFQHHAGVLLEESAACGRCLRRVVMVAVTRDLPSCMLRAHERA
jgi:hypothetical protein